MDRDDLLRILITIVRQYGENNSLLIDTNILDDVEPVAFGDLVLSRKTVLGACLIIRPRVIVVSVLPAAPYPQYIELRRGNETRRIPVPPK